MLILTLTFLLLTSVSGFAQTATTTPPYTSPPYTPLIEPPIAPNIVPNPVVDPTLWKEPIKDGVKLVGRQETEMAVARGFGPFLGELFGKILGYGAILIPDDMTKTGDDLLIPPHPRKIPPLGYIGPATLDAYQRSIRLNERLSGTVSPYSIPPFAIQNSNNLTLERAIELGEIAISEDDELREAFQRDERFRPLLKRFFNPYGQGEAAYAKINLDQAIEMDSHLRELTQRLLARIFSKPYQIIISEKVAILTHQTPLDPTTDERMTPSYIHFLNQPFLFSFPKIALISTFYPIFSEEVLQKLSTSFFSYKGELPRNKIVAKEIFLAGGALDQCLRLTLAQLMDEYFESSRTGPMSIFIDTRATYGMSKQDFEPFSRWWSRGIRDIRYPKDLLANLLGETAPFELKIVTQQRNLEGQFYNGPYGQGVTFILIDPRNSKQVLLTLLL